MPARGFSRAWLQTLSGKAGRRAQPAPLGLPPLWLCPALQTASRWPQRLHCHQFQHSLRRGLSSAASAVEQSHPNGIAAAGEAAETAGAPQTLNAQEQPKGNEEQTGQETKQQAGQEPLEELKLHQVPRYPNYAEAKRKLPLQCPGCGAFSQTIHRNQAGYYDLKRHKTLVYLGLKDDKKNHTNAEDVVVKQALANVDLAVLAEQGVHLNGLLREQAPLGQEGSSAASTPTDSETATAATTTADTATTTSTSAPGIPTAPEPAPREPPVLLCNRCHELVNHNKGVPIFHPGIDAIRETIDESPYKYNHVYHVLDAADFPMSLLPRIHDLLDTMPLRSRNRRSARTKFYANRMIELSFIVTRSDLLSPRPEKVDSLMPWVRETLRDGLGRIGRRGVRLGNVHLVSAKRNWWTKELREEIYKRGGATWMVGKANVGKSRLVHDIFPKGRMDGKALKKQVKPLGVEGATTSNAGKPTDAAEAQIPRAQEDNESFEMEDSSGLIPEAELDELELLPPRPKEQNYPAMPIASSLPGTTATPIRIPFGGGKGELIDLPGLSRTRLTDLVRPEHRQSLTMKERVSPEQVVVKGGYQSLLLGGFIRITPRTPDVVFLTYNFTPLHEHCTTTDKASQIQEHSSSLKVENISLSDTAATIKLAGSFPLKYDVTKIRTGPITRKDSANISVDRLPYRVVAMDLLIEGCGWVEIVAQVRKRDLYREQLGGQLGEPGEEPAGENETGEPNQPNEHGILESLDLSSQEETQEAEPAPEPVPVRQALPELEMEEWTLVERPKRRDSRHSDRWDARRRNQKSNEKKTGEEEEEKEKDLNWPIIDVYTPEGKFVASRRPLNAWTLNLGKSGTKRNARPKPSMKGAKRR